MREKVFFSIIVPVYNAEKYLERCIESVLNQEYDNFELLLVNDGSTDRSIDICNDYAEKDNRVIVIDKQNGGVVSARQAASEIAKGTHVVCVDADDWIDANYLSESCGYIKAYDPDIICFGYVIESITGSIPKNVFETEIYDRSKLVKHIFPRLIYSQNGEIFPPSLWGKVYKAAIFRDKHSRIDKRIKIGEDVACVIACISVADTLITSGLCPYHYFINDVSATNSKKAFPVEGPELVYQYLDTELRINDFYFEEQNKRRTVHALLNVCKSYCHISKTFFEARKIIIDIINNKFYNDVIKKTSYICNRKYNVMLFILKHRLYFLIWLYSKMDK